MSGIAGIARKGERTKVERMLEKIAHRGPAGQAIIEGETATLGIVWPKAQAFQFKDISNGNAVWDGFFGRDINLIYEDSHLVLAMMADNGLMLARDNLGFAPLYYSEYDGVMVFASEVKVLLELTRDINEFPPGHTYSSNKGFSKFFRLGTAEPLDLPAEEIAKELRHHLEVCIAKRVAYTGDIGVWLSGGLDSSTLAALARKHIPKLHTFAVGLADSPDLEYAREVANFIDATHHEVICTFEQLLEILPKVIYHLESFDYLLVRSSLTNYLVSELASEYVTAVFSGESGDELFAGYHYLKDLNPKDLTNELIDITTRLHNTAFQRVDRSSSAHSIVAHVPFSDFNVINYVMRIPSKFKMYYENGKLIEKWILRQAMQGTLPSSVLNRPKAKFWEGAGVVEHLATYADAKISDADFARERVLPDGSLLNTKEELLYYRIFREHFGELRNLSFVGRTKGAPRQ